MTAQAYQELIVKGIQGMPPHILAEVADFVYFVRQHRMEVDATQADSDSALLDEELNLLNQSEVRHLEEEFENYEQRFPSSQYIADTVALVLHLENRKMGSAAKAAFLTLEAQDTLVPCEIFVPGIALAEIMYLYERGKIQTSLADETVILLNFQIVKKLHSILLPFKLLAK